MEPDQVHEYGFCFAGPLFLARSKPGPETYNAVKWALEMGGSDWIHDSDRR